MRATTRGRTHLVRFCGAYHGWWGDVQPGIGNPLPAHETYTLKDMSEDSLRVLQTRRDIACVLVNPLQGLHPNTNAPADSSLVDSARTAHFDKTSLCRMAQAAARGLHRAKHRADLRRSVCRLSPRHRRRAGIFRRPRRSRHLWQDARRRTADRRGVRAQGFDAAISRRSSGRYLLCPRHVQLASLRDGGDERVPALHRNAGGPRRSIATSIGTWNERARQLNERLRDEALPVQVANMSSIWTVCYTQPCRYNWMLQYYLRAEGLALSWVGTGRLIFSLNYTEADFAAVADRFVAAAKAMQRGRLVVAQSGDDQQVDQAGDPQGDDRPSIAARAGTKVRRARLRRFSWSAAVPRRPQLFFLVPVGADMRIDQFAAQQRERRLVVKLDVVERVGQNFRGPHQPGLHVLDEEQLDGAEQHAADARARARSPRPGGRTRFCWRPA